MARYLDTIWCDGCGVEILWSPVLHGARDYCCEDCGRGWPCECGARQEQEDERRAQAGELSAPDASAF
jgi:hypothetical protein